MESTGIWAMKIVLVNVHQHFMVIEPLLNVDNVQGDVLCAQILQTVKIAQLDKYGIPIL